jgi:hypothetical protein
MGKWEKEVTGTPWIPLEFVRAGVSYCYDSGLIKNLKTSHILFISVISPAPPISSVSGKVSTIFTFKLSIKKAGPGLTLPIVIAN